jgi:hypothetical protein
MSQPTTASPNPEAILLPQRRKRRWGKPKEFSFKKILKKLKSNKIEIL